MCFVPLSSRASVCAFVWICSDKLNRDVSCWRARLVDGYDQHSLNSGSQKVLLNHMKFFIDY